MSTRCLNCRWFDVSLVDGNDPNLGTCRVNPPVLPINVSRGSWPLVDADDWCGSYADRPKPPAPTGKCFECGNPNSECDCIPF